MFDDDGDTGLLEHIPLELEVFYGDFTRPDADTEFLGVDFLDKLPEQIFEYLLQIFLEHV